MREREKLKKKMVDRLQTIFNNFLPKNFKQGSDNIRVVLKK